MSTRQGRFQVLLFDTFGTTVDWKGSLTEYCRRFGEEHGRSGDWDALVVQWRSLYKPAIAPVREGERLWANFDELHRETLDSLLPKYGLNTLSDSDRAFLVQGWRRLAPWPDAVAGLTRLKQRYLIAPLSNGSVRQLADMAKFGGLPWDMVFGADLFHTYKPAPAMYEGASALADAQPEAILMVAAHNADLQAAARQGFGTAFIHRPTEEAQGEADYDFVAENFNDLAEQLGA